MKKTALKLLAFLFVSCGLAFAQQPINLSTAAGTALGAPSNYGTSPGAVEVIGVNAYVTNTVPVSLGSGAIFEVSPTTAANTATNAFFQEITDGTNAMGTMTAFGSTPSTAKALNANVSLFQGTTAVGTGAPLQVSLANTASNATAVSVSLGSTISEVAPTGSANTKTNPFFSNITDGTNDLTAAISAWGTPPTGTEVMGVNANILGPIDGSGYVEVNCKTGCGAGGTMSLVPEASGGLSTKHFVAAASDNATNVKASAGQVYSIDGYNNAAYPVYFKLYNASSSPTGCAATNLFKVVGLQAGTQHTLQSEEGWAMGTGIGYCLTKGITDTDDTAVLLSDATVDIGYK